MRPPEHRLRRTDVAQTWAHGMVTRAPRRRRVVDPQGYPQGVGVRRAHTLLAAHNWIRYRI